MTYSVVKITGKQFKVQVGQTLTVDRLEAEEGEIVKLDEVLLSVDGDKVEIGTPTLSGHVVEAKVVSHTKGEKIRVSTFKAKSRYRKTKGHRQYETNLEILSLKGSAKTAEATKKEVAPKKTAKPKTE